jgi:hypothetical protein
MARVNLGTIGTDSGCFTIIDPSIMVCDIQRDEACAPTLGKVFGSCFDGAGFSFATGSDGEFRVEASFDPDTGRIYKISIDLADAVYVPYKMPSERPELEEPACPVCAAPLDAYCDHCDTHECPECGPIWVHRPA